MYIVRNLTSRMIYLQDIKAEIGPYKIVDLERQNSRTDIERSSHLREAKKAKWLQVVKESVIRVDEKKKVEPKPEVHIIEKTVEREPALNEEKLMALVRQAVSEQMGKKEDINQSVSDAIKKDIGPLMESIRDRLSQPFIQQSGEVVKRDEPSIDPTKLAEMQQKAIDKMSESIESDNVQTRKRIKIINSNAIDLANEL